VKGDQVSLLKKENETLLDLCVMRLLKDVCMLCDANWNDTVIEMCISNLKERYWHYKIDEIALILHKGAMAGYGKIYGQLKISDILNWFTEYDKEKAIFCELEATRHKEINDNYFREIEKKEQAEQRKLEKTLVRKFEAAKVAKRKVDGE
jgi:hypothetical protein